MATRRFYQAGHHTAEKATKCPEPLCPTSVLPTLERCVLWVAALFNEVAGEMIDVARS